MSATMFSATRVQQNLATDITIGHGVGIGAGPGSGSLPRINGGAKTRLARHSGEPASNALLRGSHTSGLFWQKSKTSLGPRKLCMPPPLRSRTTRSKSFIFSPPNWPMPSITSKVHLAGGGQDDNTDEGVLIFMR